MSKSRPQERELLAQVAPTIQRILPPGWDTTLDEATEQGGLTSRSGRNADGMLRVVAPDGRVAALPVEVRSLLSPRDVPRIADQLQDQQPGTERGLVVAAYLSPSSRRELTDSGLSYLDSTGNLRLQTVDPGLALIAPGAESDPFRGPERRTNSLVGLPAARVVRALIDKTPPWTMRQLAAEAATSLGSTARTVDFLDREALVSRDGGSIIDVAWPALLERWSKDYVLRRGRRVSELLAPRGIAALPGLLVGADAEVTISGSLAASRFEPLADPRLALLYARDLDECVAEIGLRETTRGANVFVIEPQDDLPARRSSREGGVAFAAPSQIYVDLMDTPGRGPEEATALLAWMTENEARWRL